mgnify:CR=1 FL=1
MPRRGENIYKRKDGRWEGRYIRGRTPAGKAEYGYVYAKSYAACREKRRRMEDALPQKPNITVTDAVNQLIVKAHAYFAKTNEDATATYGTITVTAGSTVMDIMRNFAVANQLGSEVPEGCTYMATLNGIGEFTFGQYSGWMYTDGPNWDNKATNAKFYESWNTPPIGAASYTLSEGDEICWFICCNYMHHPW